MKILQLHTNAHGLVAENGRPKGGLEKVVIDTHSALVAEGHEAYFADDCNSTYCGGLGFDMSQKAWKMTKHFMLDWIYVHKPDLIIVHGSNKLYRHLTKEGIPCLFVDHQMHISINKMYHEDLFGWTIPESRKIGSKYISVSEITCKLKEERVNQQKLFPGDFVHDGWIKFQYATDELREMPVHEGNGHFITIGRSAPDKSPHRIIKIAERHKRPWVAFTMLSPLDKAKEREYFDKHLRKYVDTLNVAVNCDRATTLNALAIGGIYVSTSPDESAGITGFEALCCGVPLMVVEGKFPHASRMFAAEGQFVGKADDDLWAMQVMNAGKKARQWIKDATIAYNSRANFVDSLLDFGSTVGKRVEKSSLESFF